MKTRAHGISSWAFFLRRASWVLALGSIVFTFGCGSNSNETATAAKYPTGISEDVEQQLKYDARVDSFDTSGDILVVNVNEAWVNSPPGMQERSVGQWYTSWHASHSGGVEVQHNGNKVATWTSEKGYRPETKQKSGESSSEG
jgi:hypothetical protein